MINSTAIVNVLIDGHQKLMANHSLFFPSDYLFFPVLFFILGSSYYSQNYASIIRQGLIQPRLLIIHVVPIGLQGVGVARCRSGGVTLNTNLSPIEHNVSIRSVFSLTNSLTPRPCSLHNVRGEEGLGTG